MAETVLMENKKKTTPKAYRGKPIIDVNRALKLRFEKGCTYEEIAKIFGVSHAAVMDRLKHFKRYIEDPESLKAFNENKVSILSLVEKELVANLLAPDKLEKASLNNVAYALQNVNNINRLEQGKSTNNLDIRNAVAYVTKDLDQAREQLAALRSEISTPQDIVLDGKCDSYNLS